MADTSYLPNSASLAGLWVIVEHLAANLHQQQALIYEKDGHMLMVQFLVQHLCNLFVLRACGRACAPGRGGHDIVHLLV